jgi:RNA polymerase sigma factor (sigma-70 family)
MVWRECWVRARGNYERCRDLVQEVSIALWMHLDGMRTGVSDKEEKAWVRWQTRTTLDHLHRSQQLPMQALTEAMAETIPDNDNTAVQEDIEELMAALSPEERQLMRLHIEGYRADEIAKIMGLRRDTVYQRMHRALGKARKALLVLFLLLVASTVAIAVVPQWRQRVFGGGEPAVEDTLSVSVPAVLSPAPSVAGDTIRDTVVTRRTWIPPEPLPHLVPVADTVLPVPIPGVAGPCGCPDSARGGGQRADCVPFDDTDDEQQEEEADVTIRVVGNNIVVEGVRDERVDVFDARGRLVATARCNDHCMLTIGMQDHSYSPTTTSGTNAFWVQVGDRPRQQVFIKQLPRGNPTHPIPASTQRILMF